MSHVSSNGKRLLARVRRIKGQVEALEKALQGEADCLAVLTQTAAIKGAAQSLMIELLGDHLQAHLVAEDDADARQAESDALTRMLRSYFK